MYEPEVNTLVDSAGTMPSAIVKCCGELKSLVKYRTVLPWGEHCTECAWPTCYETCELFDPRMDGNCRLFVDGMVRVDVDDNLRPYFLKLRFKRWGKLWTVGNLAKYSAKESFRKEKLSMALGALARMAPLPRKLKQKALAKMMYLRRIAAESAPASNDTPDCLLMECYNPRPDSVGLTMVIRPRGGHAKGEYKRMILVPTGYMHEKVPVSEIIREVDLSRPFEIEIVPHEASETMLYFGLIDFVWLTADAQAEKFAPDVKKSWKCIIWDLDNTLWNGTLIEDGPERLRLRDEVVAIIAETDRRGILHSIASKNNYADAMQVLQTMGVDKYFLYPQICWEPKSRSIARIAQLLNIGADTLAFVDDQVFEREEVRAELPHVASIDAADIGGLLSRPECQVPVTEESMQRRVMYQQEGERRVIEESFVGDYTKFLRECKIELTLACLSPQNIERVYELAQRTNQMNFSGSRYSREALEKIRRSPEYETYVMRCADRFGSYGIVGFALIETKEPRLLDLMFSCRIQGKRVEHAFLSHILNKYCQGQQRDFFANYRRTKKNEKPGKVFGEVGFEVVGEEDNVLFLRFPRNGRVPDEKIIRVRVD